MKKEQLPVGRMIRAAMEALKFSYAPYSHFKVAASLLTGDGTIYTGCNIENAAYSPGNCAERTAFFKAVSEGEQDFAAICIVNENEEGGHDICPPCGMCRQVMMEFCRPEDFFIILAAGEENYEIHTLGELLPLGFGPGTLIQNKKE